MQHVFKDKLLYRARSGVSGSVEIWSRRSGEKYAVKVYHEKESFESKKEYQKRVLYEYRLLIDLQHEAFYPPQKYTVSWNGSTVKMYMEAGSRDLAYLLRNQNRKDLDMAENLCYWKQFVAGIAYLHSRGISHRDIKLENVVLSCSGRLKIIDLATATSSNPAIGIVGSPKYMAPEMASSIKYDGRKADMWSLGIVLVYLVTNKFIWKSAHVDDISYERWARDGVSEELQGVPSALRKVVDGLLCVDPEGRYSIEDLLEDKVFAQLAYCHGDVSCGSKHLLGLGSNWSKDDL